MRPPLVRTCLLVLFASVLATSTLAQSDREAYRFRTIDPPFGRPGVDVDLQSFWLNSDGVMTAQYQKPPSGICCGLTPDFLKNMNMAVRRGKQWTNIDVPDADTTGGTNANARLEVALTYRFASEGDQVWHSALYDVRRGTLTPFANLPEYPGGLEAVGLNDRGRIAAYAYDAQGHAHGFFGDLDHHEVFDYPDPSVTDTLAQMENNSGVGVGAYVLSDGSVHAFRRWQGNAVNIDPPGSVLAIALAINDEDVIVGGYMGAEGRIFAFVLKDGQFSTVRVPNSTLTVPWYINEEGQISGTYSKSDDPLFHGVFHGFVATPVQGGDKAVH